MIEERKWGASPTFGPRQWFRQRLLAKELVKRLKSGSVLDAGCGEGRMLGLLAPNRFSLFGFDQSRECMANFATRPGSADIWQGSMAHLPAPDKSFDAVLAGDVLEHLEDDKAAVKELFRVLKKGGLALVSVPADPKKWSIDDDWSGHKRRYNKEDLVRLLESQGFVTKDCYHWGWPVIWMYHRLFYLPMLKRQLNLSASKSQPKGMASPISAAIAGLAFRIILIPDQLCLGSQSGIGLIGVFQKPLTSPGGRP
jgi:SAM-dependent methyltransferase